MRVLFLGTGTSFGVPQIGCRCAVCLSRDPRDRRARPAILVSHGPFRVVVDAPPDFRTQCLAAGLRRLDALLITHTHADHVFGLDDVRQFNRLRPGPVPLYASPPEAERLRDIFGYAFAPPACPGLTVPRLELREEPRFAVGHMRVEAVDVEHGPSTARGYVFSWGRRRRRMAYVPDCKRIPPEAAKVLSGCDLLILDALRLRKPHVSHMLLRDSLREVERLAPRQAVLTHVNHGIGLHAETEARLPAGVRLAYDGMEIRLPR